MVSALPLLIWPGQRKESKGHSQYSADRLTWPGPKNIVAQSCADLCCQRKDHAQYSVD